MKKTGKITPAQAGVDPKAIQGFLDQIERKLIQIHSYMILKGNQVFAEGVYEPCHANDHHMLFSLSKSFTSTAIGFAVEEGSPQGYNTGGFGLNSCSIKRYSPVNCSRRLCVMWKVLRS